MSGHRTNSGLVLSALILMSLLLSACNSTNVNDGLGSAKNTPPRSGQNAVTPAQGIAGSQQVQTSETALAENGATTPSVDAVNQVGTGQANGATTLPQYRVTFLPVTGAPQSAVSNLSSSLKQRSEEHSIELVPETLGGAKYRIKGYFSALDDGAGTLIVYVWDVLNSSGKRVHRISGNERAGGSSNDPWAAVTRGEIDLVANATLSRLSSWLKRNG